MKQLLFFLAIISFKAEAQSYVVNPGQKISDVLNFNDIYKYPAFKLGTVSFKNGTQSTALFNYNFVNQSMQFIHTNGDTFSLADEDLIKDIIIENDTFFYNKSYFQIYERAGNVKLCTRQFIKVASSQKFNGYNQTVEGGASVYTSMSSGAYDANLVIKEKITLVKQSSYYLADLYNNTFPVNRKNLERLFPQKKSSIEIYLKTHSVNFNQADDILTVFDYIKTL